MRNIRVYKWLTFLGLVGLAPVLLPFILTNGSVDAMFGPEGSFMTIMSRPSNGVIVAVSLLYDALGYYIFFAVIVELAHRWLRDKYGSGVSFAVSALGYIYCFQGAVGAIYLAYITYSAAHGGVSDANYAYYLDGYTLVVEQMWRTVGAVTGGLYWIFMAKPTWQLNRGLAVTSVILGLAYIIQGNVAQAILPWLIQFEGVGTGIYLLIALLWPIWYVWELPTHGNYILFD